MSTSKLPAAAFIDPSGSNKVEIEALLHQVISLLVKELAQAKERSPLPSSLPLKQLQQWAKIPEQPVDFEILLREVRSHLTHSMNAAHPGYIGHMDSIPTTMSLVGDLLVAALNNNMLSVEMSPVFSRLEPLVMQQIAARFGLGEGSGGVMVSGGSLANLQALTVARNQAFDAVKTGVVGLARQPVFFVSEVAHTSMQKAAMMMGIGSESAIALRTNSDSQVDIQDLKQKLTQAKANGQQPFAIIATAGTTVTGNIDPIPAMAEIAKTHGLWFHVDAAYGGAVIFSDKYRDLLAGVDQADSITFNPQKWLYVAKTCAIVLFKDFDILNRHFRILAPYMGDDAQWPNLGELTVQGTRHADILKLWLSLQHIGTAGYANIIQHSYRLTEVFIHQVSARSFLQLASQPQMNIVCFRLTSEEVPSDQWDKLNTRLQSYLLLEVADLSQAVFLSLPRYRGHRWLKAVLLNPYTQLETIERLFARIDLFRSLPS